MLRSIVRRAAVPAAVRSLSVVSQPAVWRASSFLDAPSKRWNSPKGLDASGSVKPDGPPSELTGGAVEPITQRHETGAGTVTSVMQPLAEIKDPAIIFSTVWNRLEAKYGASNMAFPSEIVWLMGAPGAGKGTNTPFIQHARGISSPPLIVSDLLKSDNTRQLINSGVMISDAFVLELLFETMLNGNYKSGVIIDGFPRTAVQVDTTKLLFDKMQEQRKAFFSTSLRSRFGRPVFRLVVLFVDEEESVRRQQYRGKQAKEHNAYLRSVGRTDFVEERVTDADDKLIRKRYSIFKEHYDAMLGLREKFFFHLIDATPPVEQVRSVIQRELEYQSSLELDHATYDLLQHVPLASQIGASSRHDLVRRLDGYLTNQTELFRDAIDYVETRFIPDIRRHAMGGRVLIRTDNPKCNEPLFVEMLLDILSERGYHVNVDSKILERPLRVDPKTFEIISAVNRVFFFQVAFQKQFLRSVDAM